MTDERAPYTCWSVAMPFRRSGFPVVGNMGSSVRSVVIMDRETFLRLIAENPDLTTAQFNIGRED